jgi:serine protease Do
VIRSIAVRLWLPLCLVASFNCGGAAAQDEPAATASRAASLVPADVQVPEAFTKASPVGRDDLAAMERHVRMLSEKLQQCTVSVQIGTSQGSGVIVTGDGYVLTCAHVIGEPRRRCRVIFPDGTRKRGETLGANTILDAGLIKITDPAPADGGWPHTDMADYEGIEIGDWCLATGHPGGFREDRPPVVRLGRVIFRTPRILQSDCELVGGDSGGPLFDMRGRVIAVNSRIQDDPTANYHVPISAYRGGWDRLVAGEVFESHSGALLGVSGRPATGGVEVTRVFPGEPAEVAGLLVGDVIVTFNSRKVSDLTRLTELVGEENPGAMVSLEILRDGKPMEIKVRLGMRWD